MLKIGVDWLSYDGEKPDFLKTGERCFPFGEDREKLMMYYFHEYPETAVAILVNKHLGKYKLVVDQDSTPTDDWRGHHEGRYEDDKIVISSIDYEESVCVRIFVKVKNGLTEVYRMSFSINDTLFSPELSVMRHGKWETYLIKIGSKAIQKEIAELQKIEREKKTEIKKEKMARAKKEVEKRRIDRLRFKDIDDSSIFS